MPRPNAVFFDTCVLDAEHYDFESTKMKALLAVRGINEIKLLLPASTRDEIERHISERASATINHVKAAWKDHPWLRLLPGFPKNRDDVDRITRELRDEIRNRWSRFQDKFAFRELDYTGIDVSELMNSYRLQVPPFGPGNKQKEFPDAVTIMALRRYAEKANESIAVISLDNDFAKACSPRDGLLHFPSLNAFTSALLEEDRRYEKAREIMLNAKERLIAKIREEFADRLFVHADDPNGEGYVEGVVPSHVELDTENLEVVGLGHTTFTVGYSANVTFTADVGYDDPNSWVSGDPGDDVIYLHRCEGRVEADEDINGSALFSVSKDWTTGTLESLSIEEDFIQVHSSAPEVDDRDPNDGLPEPGARG